MDEIWSQVKKQSVLAGLFKFSISLEGKFQVNTPKEKKVPKKTEAHLKNLFIIEKSRNGDTLGPVELIV